MATKHKRHTKPGAVGLLQQARRSLEKGDFKQALKDAKVCYRQEPGPESRQFLERAYLARARQLHRAGLRTESQAVVEALLELGVTDASVEQELPELLIAVGLFGRTGAAGKGGPSLKEDDPLRVVVADHAVLRPEGAPASLPAIRQGAAAIRQALAALEKGEEAEAMAVLKDIPRASPFADWKYLVRGLAAYYREDAAEMHANWDRLDPGRFAARIAAPLKVLANPEAEPSDAPHVAGKLARLKCAVAAGAILSRLEKLRCLVNEGSLREAVKLLRASATLLREMDPGLPQRLGMVLCATLVHKGAVSAVRELATAIEPPRIDPHWNRGLAMAWEQCEDGDLSDAEEHWQGYLEDLAGLECLSPAERTLAQALVWLRVAEMLFEESSHICPTCGVCHDPDEPMQRRAITCFEQSLQLAPELLKAHQALASAFEKWDEPEKAAAAYRRLIERFPENLDSLLFLSNHYMNRDEPIEARPFLFRAQRLKPLDPRIKTAVGDTHLATARHYAMAGRWDEGRAELAAMEKLLGSHSEIHPLLVHRAALEFKAGEFGRAHRLLDQARSTLGESAPIWLLMTLQSARYALQKVVQAEFDGRWLAAMKKNRTSVAAGEMCRIMFGELATDREDPDCDQRAQCVVDFVQHCSRTKWQARDLRGVLEFLIYRSHDEKRREDEFSRHGGRSLASKLLAKLAAKARKKFPDDAFFQQVAGEMELRKGPRKCNRRLARECFQRALELAEGANDSDSLETAKRAKERLHFLDEAGPGPSHAVPPFARAADREPDFLDLPEDDGEILGPSAGESPEELIETFARLCRQAGMDPEEVLNDVTADMPFRFGPGGGRKPERKKRR